MLTLFAAMLKQVQQLENGTNAECQNSQRSLFLGTEQSGPQLYRARTAWEDADTALNTECSCTEHDMTIPMSRGKKNYNHYQKYDDCI